MAKQPQIWQLVEKFLHFPDRFGGGGGVNPSGQPDRFFPVFFLMTPLRISETTSTHLPSFQTKSKRIQFYIFFFSGKDSRTVPWGRWQIYGLQKESNWLDNPKELWSYCLKYKFLNEIWTCLDSYSSCWLELVDSYSSCWPKLVDSYSSCWVKSEDSYSSCWVKLGGFLQ